MNPTEKKENLIKAKKFALIAIPALYLATLLYFYFLKPQAITGSSIYLGIVVAMAFYASFIWTLNKKINEI